MVESHLEREVKLEVDEGFVMPNLTAKLPQAARVELIHQHLDSRYFDTVDRRLSTAKMTLRYRTGTGETAWQLKLPRAPAREELWVNAPADSVPTELETLLRGVTGGATLIPAATLITERAIHRVFDATGAAWADIADDRVQATTLLHLAPNASVSSEPSETEATEKAPSGIAPAQSWREVEVELTGQDPTSLDALTKTLRKAGARHSLSRSKLERAFGATEAEHAPMDRAGQAVCAYLVQQHRVILAGDVALRRGHDAAVHPTRVAIRRLRSVLRCYESLFEPGSTDTLDEELRWFAGLLGQVRDLQVLRPRLLERVAQLPSELLIGPVAARIETELRREQAEHWTSLERELGGERYLVLLSRLARWIAQPSGSPDAEEPAASLLELAHRAARKAARRLEAATAADDPDALHRARKAAKRARYAYEVVAPVTQRQLTRKKVKRLLELQDLIGAHQDSQLSAKALLRLGAVAGRVGGENGFSFGVLCERERASSALLRKAVSNF